MVRFSITLFGALQTVYGKRVMEIEAVVPVNVLALQKEVLSRLGQCDLPVALAENGRILKRDDVLENARPLMALPPVCGG